MSTGTFLAALVWLTVLQSATPSQGRRNRCLAGGIRVLGATPDTVTLSWNYTCLERHEVSFKVYYEHQAWNACQSDMRDEKRGKGVGNIETR